MAKFDTRIARLEKRMPKGNQEAIIYLGPDDNGIYRVMGQDRTLTEDEYILEVDLDKVLMLWGGEDSEAKRERYKARKRELLGDTLTD